MSNTAAAKEVAPYLTWGFGETEDSDTEFEWECLCDNLTELMQKINPKGQWHCNVQNFGWMARNGFKNLVATKGSQLLSGILPNTDCHFRIFVMGKGFGRYLKIQNFHHDSPTGNEWYEVRRFNGRIHPAS
jgi:hypothetical protein